MRKCGLAFASFVLILLSGCGQPETEEPEVEDTPAPDAVRAFLDGLPELDVSRHENVEAIAGVTHPSNPIFMTVFIPKFLADFGIGAGATCPALLDMSDPTTGELDLRYLGGCTDEADPERPTDDFAWSGALHIRGTVDALEITYDNFGITVFPECDGEVVSNTLLWHGTIRMLSNKDLSHTEYDFLVRTDNLGTAVGVCEPTDISIGWDLEVRADGYHALYAPLAQEITLSASGDVGHSQVGVWRAEADELVHLSDDSCSEPLSGRYTLTGGGFSSSLALDGQTACDLCAAWEVDGVPMIKPVCGLSGL